jgi:hypothetical protein
MTTKRKRKPSIKKQTIAEFRAWIEGVEELQPEDWSPDASQWVLIRNRIDKIIEGDVPLRPNLVPRYPNNPQGFIPPAPPAGGIPAVAPENTDISDAAAKLLKGGTKENPAKTPEITDGNFNSPFA